MAKETYYFSHDYEPIGDPKMQAMVGAFGGLGYGIFWRIVEMLHAESDHVLPLKPFLFVAIAEQMKTTPEFIEKFITKCIYDFELFVLFEANRSSASSKRSTNEFASGASFFASNRVHRNIEAKSLKKGAKSEAGRKGGIKSGESRRSKQCLKQTNQIEAVLEPNEPNEAKERKGKENINTQLCPEMLSIFKFAYPEYPEDRETDFTSCLQIAYKIAKIKKWSKESVVNGKLNDTLEFWKTIVDFSKTDTWFSTRAISDFDKEFQRLIQKMNTRLPKNGDKKMVV